MFMRWHAATSPLIGGVLFTAALKFDSYFSGRGHRVSMCFHLIDLGVFILAF